MLEVQKNLRVMAAQYKVAMLIGLSLDLHEMLAKFLPEAMSVLNCTGGQVLLKNKQENKLNCIYSYPKSNAEFVLSLKDQIDHFYNNFFNNTMEKKYYELIKEKNYHYFFMIGSIGVLTLQAHEILPDEIIIALRPLLLRLETACNACLQYGITETSYQEIFEHSPIALFEFDCSALREHLLQLQSSGIKNIDAYLQEHPDKLNYFYTLIKAKNINLYALNLYAAESKSALSSQLNKIFGGASLPLLSKMFAAMTNGDQYFHQEGVTYSLDDTRIDIDLTYSMLPIHGDTFEKVLFSVVDITELKSAESRLEFLATHDFLTGLPNRILLHSALEMAMNRTYRSNKGMGLLYIDIDNFKLINDKLGHEVGDNFLAQGAKKLLALVRKDDSVARVGGDEFVIIINNLASPQEMEDISKKIQERFSSTPFEIGKHKLTTSISIGAAYFPQKNETYTGLMRHADSALYAAKLAGKNCVRIYEANNDPEEE